MPSPKDRLSLGVPAQVHLPEDTSPLPPEVKHVLQGDDAHTAVTTGHSAASCLRSIELCVLLYQVSCVFLIGFAQQFHESDVTNVSSHCSTAALTK